MGFIRGQEERLALHFLRWQYQRMNLTEPAPSELQRQAGKIVDDAHSIARQRGGNIVSIIKELIRDVQKK